MKYKREIVGLKSAKRPHERDKSYARASGKFHAIRLLTSLSEDILAGSFAFNGQSEVDDD